jgi:hypothetical protein
VARASIQQLPAFVQPMAAQVVQRLPEGDEWMYEVKFDGYRALLVKNEKQPPDSTQKQQGPHAYVSRNLFRWLASSGTHGSR